MKSITPYLFFAGTCKDALRFYEYALDGRIGNLLHYKDIPGTEPEFGERVLNSSFHAENIHFMASDNHDEAETPANRVELCLNFTSAESIETAFARLSEGGTVVSPLEDTFWNARFGVCIDKFGIKWMFNFERDKAV